MRTLNRATITLLVAALLLTTDSVFGGGVSIKITNDTTDRLLVTIYDQNFNPPQKVLPGESIGGFASVPISVTADDAGQAHVSWTATTVDKLTRMCGRGEASKLDDGSTVNVHADGDCTSR